MTSMKPIRILQVVGAMNCGGTETMLMNIYRNINRERVQFDFISYSTADAYYDEEIKTLGGRVIKLTKTSSLKELFKTIKKYGPYHAVHSHTLFHCGLANLAGLLAGVKVRVSHAHTTFDHNNGVLRKIYFRLMKLLINSSSTHLLACSNGSARYLFGEKTLKKLKYSYFPNVIDYAKYMEKSPNEVRRFKIEQGLGNCVIVGHIGRFIEAKNHTLLLEIMKELLKKNPTVKLLLVGEGELKEDIQAKAYTEGIDDNVKFLGIRKDISTILQSLDVFVFPSIYEGLGLVLLEAQASGVPCVVSEAVQPEADLNLLSRVSLDDDPEVWATKILEAAGRKEYNSRKIKESFDRNGYSVPRGIKKLMDIYESCDGEGYEKPLNRLI